MEALAIIGRQSSSEAGDGDGAMVGFVEPLAATVVVEALAAFMAAEALVDSMVVEASMAVGTEAAIGKPQIGFLRFVRCQQGMRSASR